MRGRGIPPIRSSPGIRLLVVVSLVGACALENPDFIDSAGSATSSTGSTASSATSTGSTTADPGTSTSTAGSASGSTGAPETTTGELTTTGEPTTSGDPSTSAEPTTMAEGTDTTAESTEGQCEGTGCLSEEGLLLRYFLDDPSLGWDDKLAADSASNPLHLMIKAGGSGPSYAESDSNWGLEWSQAGANGVATAPVNGTKVTQLHGATRATIEVVAAVDDALTSPSRLVHIGSGSEGGRFTLSVASQTALRFVWQGETVYSWGGLASLQDRAVIHLVLDSTAMNPMDRLRLYVDGFPTSPPMLPQAGPIGPDAGITLNQGLGEYFCLGNRENGSRSFDGILHYAAVYTEALSPERITEHAAILLVSDDSP